MDHMMERLTVLIVDDNSHMISIVKTILRGFDVKEFLEAPSATAAFEFVKSVPIDLIITDFAMEPENGCDFTRRVRTSPESPNQFVPIIMLSAYAERSKVEAARDAGVTEFCAKPVTATELYKKVCTVINSPRPFVRTALYFGPDRRRNRDETWKGPERRQAHSAPNDTQRRPVDA